MPGRFRRGQHRGFDTLAAAPRPCHRVTLPVDRAIYESAPPSSPPSAPRFARVDTPAPLEFFALLAPDGIPPAADAKPLLDASPLPEPVSPDPSAPAPSHRRPRDPLHPARDCPPWHSPPHLQASRCARRSPVHSISQVTPPPHDRSERV